MAKEDKKQEEELEVQAEGSEGAEDLELEIVDDTPPEDRGRPRRKEGEEPEIPSDDEIEDYSEAVQKRIKKLRYEFHEERRQKEEAKRLEEEAIQQAQRATAEAERLRKMVSEGQSVLYSQAESRVDAQLEAAKRAYKEAYESGDPDKLIEAQEKLSTLHAEKMQISSYKSRPQPQQQPQQQPPQQPQQQRPQVPQPSERAKEWAMDNDWFQKDQLMTAFAMGVHKQLVDDGIAVDSADYYRQIDDHMRKRFPEKFEKPQSERASQAAPVVAPASRATTRNPRKVRLTQTQVALAKRLGVPPEKYAAQLLKDQKDG